MLDRLAQSLESQIEVTHSDCRQSFAQRVTNPLSAMCEAFPWTPQRRSSAQSGLSRASTPMSSAASEADSRCMTLVILFLLKVQQPLIKTCFGVVVIQARKRVEMFCGDVYHASHSEGKPSRAQSLAESGFSSIERRSDESAASMFPAEQRHALVHVSVRMRGCSLMARSYSLSASSQRCSHHDRTAQDGARFRRLAVESIAALRTCFHFGVNVTP